MNDYAVALIDCDSFFVSCEQAVNKDLQGKPVCVLSNNNGCVLARSKEAKLMGIKMGEPYFMAKKHSPDCIYLSGNYELYSVFSRKVMEILKDFSPTVEVYSIDEAFVDLSGLKTLYKADYPQIAYMIRERVKNELSINVSIGISQSKVLAKLACEKAKAEGLSGIYSIDEGGIKQILRDTKIDEIWGIGRNTAILLNRSGILNCSELVAKSDMWLKENIGKRGVELKHELLGECIDKVKINRKLPKSIQNTRSFPKFTNDFDYIKNALNIHIHTCCTRLRRYEGKCKNIGVLLRTKDFRVFYEKKNLENLSDFELEISKEAMKLLEKIYVPEVIYRSCGITLDNLNYSEESQLGLFFEGKKKNYQKLGKAIDKLEAKFGKNIVKTGFLDEIDKNYSSNLQTFQPPV